MKVIIIGENSYSMGETMAKAVLKTAKDSMRGKNAIYAIEKNNVIEMKHDVYPSIEVLKEQTKQYVKQGYKVRYLMGGTHD